MVNKEQFIETHNLNNSFKMQNKIAKIKKKM